MYLLQKFIVSDEYRRVSLVARMVKNLTTMQEMQVWVRKIPWRRE